MKWIIWFLIFSFFPHAFSQDLLASRIRKMTDRKKSIYLTEGIFHSGKEGEKSTLMNVRHSFKKNEGYERIVFDFASAGIPRIYGNINIPRKKIYLDLFDTQLSQAMSSLGNSRYISAINFFPIDGSSLSVEMDLKQGVGVDIFYLQNQGRLVIDLKQ